MRYTPGVVARTFNVTCVIFHNVKHQGWSPAKGDHKSHNCLQPPLACHHPWCTTLWKIMRVTWKMRYTPEVVARTFNVTCVIFHIVKHQGWSPAKGDHKSHNCLQPPLACHHPWCTTLWKIMRVTWKMRYTPEVVARTFNVTCVICHNVKHQGWSPAKGDHKWFFIMSNIKGGRQLREITSHIIACNHP